MLEGLQVRGPGSGVPGGEDISGYFRIFVNEVIRESVCFRLVFSRVDETT